jgi:hypothetical protein
MIQRPQREHSYPPPPPLSLRIGNHSDIPITHVPITLEESLNLHNPPLTPVLLLQILPRQESRIRIPGLERAPRVEDQGNMGEGDETTR